MAALSNHHPVAKWVIGNAGALSWTGPLAGDIPLSPFYINTTNKPDLYAAGDVPYVVNTPLPIVHLAPSSGTDSDNVGITPLIDLRMIEFEVNFDFNFISAGNSAIIDTVGIAGYNADGEQVHAMAAKTVVTFPPATYRPAGGPVNYNVTCKIYTCPVPAGWTVYPFLTMSMPDADYTTNIVVSMTTYPMYNGRD